VHRAMPRTARMFSLEGENRRTGRPFDLGTGQISKHPHRARSKSVGSDNPCAMVDSVNSSGAPVDGDRRNNESKVRALKYARWLHRSCVFISILSAAICAYLI
jgi:hypothetical protein